MRIEINKSNWTPRKLGEVVTKIEENDKENARNRFDRFLKVEHIDAESLHIKRWASQETGDELNPYFYKIFRKGQILFPTRNPHLRRTVFATFDGICGEKTLTLEPIQKLVIPEFIPFLFHSETFYAHSTGAIIGSTNPHVRWRDVAKYEFLLPPKDQQAKLADLLWAIDEVIEREKEVYEKFEKSLLCLLKNTYCKISKREELINLCIKPPKYGANSPAIEFDNKIRYIRITDIGSFGNLNNDKVSAHEHDDNYLLKYGDFLMARSADPGRSYFYKNSDGKCTHAGYLIKFSLNLDKILPEFLYFFTQTKEFKLWIKQTTRTGTLSNINSKEFSRLKVPVINIDEQRRIIVEINHFYKIYREVGNKIACSQALFKSIINQIF